MLIPFGFWGAKAGIGGPYWINLFGQYGATTGQSSNGVAVDPLGNVYVYGSSDHPTYIVNQSAKFDINGALQWQTWFGSGSPYYTNQPRNCAVDKDGNLYSTSSLWSGMMTGQVLKQSPSGTGVWRIFQSEYAGPNEYYTMAIAVDASSNLYTAGYSNSQGRGTIIKSDSSGTTIYTSAVRVLSGNYRHYAVAFDSAGNAYGAGSRSYVGTHFQVTKVDSGGGIQWSKHLTSGGNITEVFEGVATNSTGDVYVNGHSNSGGNNEIITAKYNSSGVLQWQRKLSGSGGTDDVGNGVALDKSGNVFVAGYTSSGGNYKMFLAKYNPSGTLQFQRVIGTSGKNFFANKITIDSGDNIYVTGSTNLSGGDDMITVKLKSDGSQTGTYTVGSYSVTIAAGSLTDSASSLTSEDLDWIQTDPFISSGIVGTGSINTTTWSSTSGTI